MRAIVILTAVLSVLLSGCDNSTPPTDAANGGGEASANSGDAISDPHAPAATNDAPPPTADGTESPMNTAATTGIDEQFAQSYKGRNRLAESTSPYLLQHQHNPVHWQEWGEEAFEAARKLDRPILLSIGYSTCYWCHVMERESFESEDVAQVMNDGFIAIKVDREERPDVDEIYMTACQIISQGRGGWPLTVFLEPDTLKPFFAGTYYPKPQFVGLLNQVKTVWRDNRAGIMQDAENLGRVIQASFSEAPEPVVLTRRSVDRAVSTLLAGYDQVNGGFSRGAPKFPMPAQIDLLLEAGWDLTSGREAVAHTLDRMATGGMYDQVGGGFHRYSVDDKWLVPHFEKMLYDNGQLAATYARAHELTGDAYYAEVARETLDYVLREMRDPAGGFWSAQDAEVNHREGENYLWTADQIEQTLRQVSIESSLGEVGTMEEDIEFTLKVYGLDQGTNFTDPHHPEDVPKNVIHLASRPDVLAEQLGLSLEEFNLRIELINEVLYFARTQREQPATDDKVLASWNGLMIAGLAEGGRVLDESKYVEAAHEAAEFVLTTMRTEDGGLLHTYRDGEARIEGLLEDYALMIRGLIALHRATNDDWPLEQARALAAEADERFFDESGGFYYDTQSGQSDLFVRTRTTRDGALPAGNTTMALNLVDLYDLTGETAYREQAKRTLDFLSVMIDRAAPGAPIGVLALHRYLGETDEAQVAAPTTAPAQTTPTIPSAYDRQETVAVNTSPNLLRLAAGATDEFTLTLTIARGYHINANQPGQEMLIPLELRLVGGEGLELEVDYPEGEQYDGPAGSAMVHHGTVEFPVRIRRTGDITGRPEVVLTYQACDDRQCLMPVTEPLPVRFRAE